MSPETKQILINRFKSFLWRAGIMLATAAVGFVAQNIGLLHLDPFWVTLIGLALGEVTKLINKISSQPDYTA